MEPAIDRASEAERHDPREPGVPHPGLRLRELPLEVPPRGDELSAPGDLVRAAGDLAEVDRYSFTNATTLRSCCNWRSSTTYVDGRQIGWKSDVIDSATGKSAGPELAPGTPYRLQYVFDAEPGRKLKEFTLAMPAGRTIVVDAR